MALVREQQTDSVQTGGLGSATLPWGTRFQKSVYANGSATSLRNSWLVVQIHSRTFAPIEERYTRCFEVAELRVRFPVGALTVCFPGLVELVRPGGLKIRCPSVGVGVRIPQPGLFLPMYANW